MCATRSQQSMGAPSGGPLHNRLELVECHWVVTKRKEERTNILMSVLIGTAAGATKGRPRREEAIVVTDALVDTGLGQHALVHARDHLPQLGFLGRRVRLPRCSSYGRRRLLS